MGNSFCSFIRSVLFNLDDDLYDEIKNKVVGEDADDFYNTIDENSWTLILQLFIIRINILILNAPSTTEPFICFRGSGDDYIHQNHQMTILGNNASVFRSTTRISSISINYNTARQFYDNSDGTLKTLYRVLINPVCKLLFTTPFAPPNIKSETEFIIPCNHCFGSQDGFIRNISLNCFDNGNNICHHNRQKIYSKDVILMPIYS